MIINYIEKLESIFITVTKVINYKFIKNKLYYFYKIFINVRKAKTLLWQNIEYDLLYCYLFLLIFLTFVSLDCL